MKKIYALLGVALLMGCGGNQDDACGKIAKQTTPVSEQKAVAQEQAPVVESSVTPSK